MRQPRIHPHQLAALPLAAVKNTDLVTNLGVRQKQVTARARLFYEADQLMIKWLFVESKVIF